MINGVAKIKQKYNKNHMLYHKIGFIPGIDLNVNFARNYIAG